MKKHLINILFILFTLLSQAQDNYKFYPGYKEVVKMYFENYSSKNVSENTILKFEKRPDGWHAVIRAYTANYPLQKDGLIWSLKTKGYEDLNFIKLKEGENNMEEYHGFLNHWEAIHYNVSPYFGYTGYDWDVIQAYKNTDALPDTLLYGVARAYSTYASNLLNDNSGLSDSTHRFKLKDGKNALTAEQLKTYLIYRHKAIELFKKVKEKDPYFETLVGSIGIKLAHEYVTAYLDLKQYQNDEEALKELPDNSYSEFYVSLAKNYLNSCQQNAILFTNGDTDTYPLLYVQEKYKFRTDVTVINISLLQTQRYIDHLRYNIGTAKGLDFTFKSEELKDTKREVIYLKEDSSKILKLKKVIAFLKDDKNITELKQGDYFIIKGNNLKTKIANKNIEWQLPSKGYILKNELMMLDIILNYQNKRPLYFAQTMGSDAFLGLSQYMSLEGLAYKLDNKKTPPTTNDGHIDSKSLYNSLILNYSWAGNDHIDLLDFRFVVNYGYQFIWLANSLIYEQENQKAKEVLDNYFTNFPDKFSPYENTVIHLMESYYKLGDTDKANEIGKTIIFNVKNKKINKPTLFDTDSQSEQNEKAIAKIKIIAEKYGQTSFYEKLLN